MTKVFNILTKIELTEKQNAQLDAFFSMLKKYDVNNETSEVYLSMADVTNGVLNNEFCPIMFIDNARPSDELYENIKENCELIPEYVSRTEELPTQAVVLWKKGE